MKITEYLVGNNRKIYYFDPLFWSDSLLMYVIWSDV